MKAFKQSQEEFNKVKEESYRLLDQSYSLPKINLSTLYKTDLEAYIQKLEKIKSYNIK
jgi:hypothetical protein